jgi:hypothetical protein
MKLDHANVSVVQNLILQSLVNEAGVARFALEMLIRFRAAGASLDIDRLAEAISTIIRHHGPLLHSSEVAWALWGAIVFKIEVDDNTARLAIATGDPVVTLLALDAHSRGLIALDLPTQLAAEIGQETFGSERWLLLYEATKRNWLAKDEVLQPDGFTASFEKLGEANVSFYDSDVEVAKVDRAAADLHTIKVPVLGLVFGY